MSGGGGGRGGGGWREWGGGLVVDKKRACVCVCVCVSEETKRVLGKVGDVCVCQGGVQKGVLACGCNRVGD